MTEEQQKQIDEMNDKDVVEVWKKYFSKSNVFQNHQKNMKKI